jgi:hypothetical protein
VYLSVGGFGRRASDGGANLQMFFSRQLEGVWSQPGSQEQLQMVCQLKNIVNYRAKLWSVEVMVSILVGQIFQIPVSKGQKPVILQISQNYIFLGGKTGQIMLINTFTTSSLGVHLPKCSAQEF